MTDSPASPSTVKRALLRIGTAIQRPARHISRIAEGRFRTGAAFIAVAGFDWFRTQVFMLTLLSVFGYFFIAGASPSLRRWTYTLILAVVALTMLHFILWCVFRAGEIVVLRRRVVLYDAYRMLLTFVALIFLFASLYLILQSWVKQPLFAIEHKTRDSVDMLYVSAVKQISLGFGGSEPVHWLSKIMVLIQVVSALFLTCLLSSVIVTGILPRSGEESQDAQVPESTREYLERRL